MAANPQIPPNTTLQWTSPLGITNIVKLDAVRDLDDDRSSEVTRHAIESGASIADHVIQNPDQLVITILSTNTPLFPDKDNDFDYGQVNLEVRQSQFVPRGLFLLSAGVGVVTDAAADLLGAASGSPANTVKVTVLQSPNTVNRINLLHSELINLKNNATLVTITLNGRTYPDQVLTSVKKTQGPGQFGLGVLPCIFQSITTVEAANVPLADAADLLVKRKRVKAAKAKQQLLDAQKDAKDKASNKAVLAVGLDAAKGFL